MKRFYTLLLFFLAAGSFVFNNQANAKEKTGASSIPRVNRSSQQGTTNQTLVNIGQVAMWIFSDAASANTPGGSSGLFFPRGNNPSTAAIFQDGFIWGGLVDDGAEPAIRVGGQTYSIGTVPGAILGLRTGNAEDQNDLTNVDRIWRIRRDFNTANLQQDAAEFNEIQSGSVTDAQMDELRAIYRQDWLDWPTHKGAPFTDADGDGQYNPAFNADGSPKLAPGPEEEFDPAIHADEPGYGNGDQVVWLVANDLDPGAVSTTYGSPSIGLELQITLWAYQRADALGQIVFKQFRIIYKGTATTPLAATIDSLHFCQWSDPDLGGAGDDFVFTDVDKSLVAAYNASSSDATYALVGLPPPASGYDFFAGPLVADPEGEAIFGLQKRPGFSNLPMTTAGFFAAGGADSDPTRGGDYNGTLQWWNLLRGLRPRPEFPPAPWIDPTTNEVTKFVLSGDPVTNTGWVDSSPGDRRLLLAAGPFTMAVGDTQETVVATLAALGSDRLSSISVLRFVDRFAQEAFDNLFDLPSPPPQPLLTASEFDGRIVLNWGGNKGVVATTENTVSKGFIFEGYNVYQLESAGAVAKPENRIATFDLVSDPTTITQETFDEGSGQILELPVQFGTNSGKDYKLTVDRDILRDQDLFNGKEYFFGVTAYNRNPEPGATVKTLESTPSVVTVVPQTAKPGVRFNSDIFDVVNVAHTPEIGGSDGVVTPLIVDPAALTGDSYEVAFTVVADTTSPLFGQTVWSLTNTTTGETLFENQTNQSGDNEYLVTEGLQVKVSGPPPDFKRFAMISNGNGPITETFGFEATPPPVTYTGYSADWYRDVLTTPNGGILAGGGPNGNTALGGFYFFVAGGNTITSHAAAVGRILRQTTIVAIPNDYEIRFTDAENKGIMAFSTEDLVDIPFELWFMGPSTLDDDSDDVRMIPWVLDVFDALGDDTHGGQNVFNFGLDHQASGGNNDPYSDWIYWRMPADDSPGEAGYNQFVADATAGTYDFASPEHLARTVIMNWNQNQGDGGVNEFPESGVTIRIELAKINTPRDVFAFSTADVALSQNQTTETQDVLELVNVFPNPYLGFQESELNTFTRFVTFSHLPENAIIRIFNLAGVLVRTIEKSSPSQFEQWNMLNDSELPVASGIYIANIEMPDLGVSKNLKLIIIQEQQFLRNF